MESPRNLPELMVLWALRSPSGPPQGPLGGPAPLIGGPRGPRREGQGPGDPVAPRGGGSGTTKSLGFL